MIFCNSFGRLSAAVDEHKRKGPFVGTGLFLVCGGAENTLRTAGGMSDALLYDFMDAPTNIFQKIRRTLLGPIEILSRRDEAT